MFFFLCVFHICFTICGFSFSSYVLIFQLFHFLFSDIFLLLAHHFSLWLIDSSFFFLYPLLFNSSFKLSFFSSFCHFLLPSIFLEFPSFSSNTSFSFTFFLFFVWQFLSYACLSSFSNFLRYLFLHDLFLHSGALSFFQVNFYRSFVSF